MCTNAPASNKHEVQFQQHVLSTKVVAVPVLQNSCFTHSMGAGGASVPSQTCMAKPWSSPPASMCSNWRKQQAHLSLPMVAEEHFAKELSAQTPDVDADKYMVANLAAEIKIGIGLQSFDWNPVLFAGGCQHTAYRKPQILCYNSRRNSQHATIARTM